MRLGVQLLGSGTILREVLAAADLLASDFEVAADVWSVPSFTELRREGLDAWTAGIDCIPLKNPNAAMWKRRWPTDRDRSSRQRITSGHLPIQIRPFIDRRYAVLGTDGFGRSDYRKALRSFFEVDRHFVTLTALHALAQEGLVPRERVAEAISKYEIDPEEAEPHAQLTRSEHAYDGSSSSRHRRLRRRTRYRSPRRGR